MINTKYLLYISTCLLISGNVQATDFNLTYDSSGTFPHSLALHTQLHTPKLKPMPLFKSGNEVKLAAVCSVGGGGCNGLSFGSSDNSMNLDKNFQCEDEGYVKTCPTRYVPDTTQKCPYNSSYFKCKPCTPTCDDEYVIACRKTQVITAYYTTECGNTCYQCRDKTCTEGGYSEAITSCQNGTAVSFANQTCYQDVSDKSCEDLGYKSSVPENNKCTPVTECGKSCQSDCHQPTCEESGFLTTCPSNHDCETVTTNTYGRTCYKDKGQPTCEDGGYKSGIPTNNVCTQVEYFGNRCFDKCYQPTCENGGYLDACPNGQTGTLVAYYGRNCYANCSEAQCTVSNCKECVSGSTTDCKICDDGYRLASGEAGSYCAYDTYQTCCRNQGSLYGRYDKTTDKFEKCYNNNDLLVCNHTCLSSGCPGYGTTNNNTSRYSVDTCDKLKTIINNSINDTVFSDDRVLSIEKDLNCPNMDFDYTNTPKRISILIPAYHSGNTPSSVSLKQGETLKESNKVYKLQVKSFSSSAAGGVGFGNIELTATNKVVLHNVALSNSTIIAPKVYLSGKIGLTSSKIIADDIYVASETNISFGILPQKITVYWETNNKSYYECTSDNISKITNTSFIGSLERPVAFHFDPNANKEEFIYGAITSGERFPENLKIYGYNVESSPLFSELHFKNGDYHMTINGHLPYSVTINDPLGKAQSNLFYRFQTVDFDTNTGAYYYGYLIYEGQQQLCKKMKENAYLTPFGSGSSCILKNAEQMITCNSIDYDKATCPILGKLDKSDPTVKDWLDYCEDPDPDDEYCKYDFPVDCEKDNTIYQQSNGKLECYTCVINNCIDHYNDEYLGENNAECSSGMQDKIVADYDSEFEVDKNTPSSLWPAPQCILVQPNESAEDACERVRDKWLNQDGTNPKAITPLRIYETKAGKCAICKLSFS